MSPKLGITFFQFTKYLEFDFCVCVCCRPLTQAEISQRREIARQRHADRMAVDQTTKKNNEDQCGPEPSDLSAGSLTTTHSHTEAKRVVIKTSQSPECD